MRKLLPFVAGVLVLAGCSSLPSGIVNAKHFEPAYSYSCQVGSVPVGSTQVPIFGSCYVSECYRIEYHDADDSDSACVSPQDYERIAVGDRFTRS